MPDSSGSGHTYECEVAEDIGHQRRVWICERIFWTLWTLIIIAALLGLLGHGPLSNRSLPAGDSGLRIEYKRFERYQAASLVTVQVQADTQRGPVARLAIGGDYLERFRITDIEPQPAQVEAWPDRHVYVFNLPEPGSTAELIFHLQPISFGALQTTMQLDGRAAQRYTQFIFP